MCGKVTTGYFGYYLLVKRAQAKYLDHFFRGQGNFTIVTRRVVTLIFAPAWLQHCCWIFEFTDFRIDGF